MILFDANKCVSCNSCIRACPTPEANKAVQTEDGRTVYNIDPDKCIRCGACIHACPTQAVCYHYGFNTNKTKQEYEIKGDVKK